MRPRRSFGFDAASHERHHGWQGLLARVVVCSSVSALGWWVGGWIGVIISLRLWALALADDLMALILNACHGMRLLAFRPVEGRFYQFKGQRIRVEDDALLPQRWLALADLSRALGAPLPATVLRRRGAHALFEQRDGLYVLDDVVLTWLREQRGDRAGRLALWIEREVWYPARGRQASYKKKGAPHGTPED